MQSSHRQSEPQMMRAANYTCYMDRLSDNGRSLD
jgi:hypothetical protein